MWRKALARSLNVFLSLCWIGRIGRSNGPHWIQQQRPAIQLRPENHAEQQGWPQAGKSIPSTQTLRGWQLVYHRQLDLLRLLNKFCISSKHPLPISWQVGSSRYLSSTDVINTSFLSASQSRAAFWPKSSKNTHPPIHSNEAPVSWLCQSVTQRMHDERKKKNS